MEKTDTQKENSSFVQTQALFLSDPLESKRDIGHFLQCRLGDYRDFPLVRDILVRCFVQTYREKLPEVTTNQDRVLELLEVESRAKEGLLICIELGSRIIGTAALIHPHSKISQSSSIGYSNLRCVAVEPSFRGLGIVDFLMKSVVNIALNAKHPGIFLHVQKGADKVAEIYKRHGFVRDPLGDISTHGNEIFGYRLDMLSAN